MAQDVQDMYAKGRLTRNKFALGAGKAAKAAVSGALGVLSVPAPPAAEDDVPAAEGGARELPALTAQEQP